MVYLLSKNTNFRFDLLQRLFQPSSESLYSRRLVFGRFQAEDSIIPLFLFFDTMKPLSPLHFLFNRRASIIETTVYVTIQRLILFSLKIIGDFHCKNKNPISMSNNRLILRVCVNIRILVISCSS